MVDIVNKIEQMRLERGWSVYKLAKLSGLSDKCIYNWKARRSVPTIQGLEGICDAFGITISQFLSEGNYVEVNAETKELLDDWFSLTQEQKEAVKVMLKTMKG